jgi:hypothetical protein
MGNKLYRHQLGDFIQPVDCTHIYAIYKGVRVAIWNTPNSPGFATMIPVMGIDKIPEAPSVGSSVEFELQNFSLPLNI